MLADFLDLGVQGFLEAYERVFLSRGDEVQLGGQLGAANVPRVLAEDGMLGGVPDVVSDNP